MARSCGPAARGWRAECRKRQAFVARPAMAPIRIAPGAARPLQAGSSRGCEAPSPIRQPSPTIAGPSIRTPSPRARPRRRPAPAPSTSAPSSGLAARTPLRNLGRARARPRPRRAARRGCPGAARRGCRCRSSRRRSRASRRATSPSSRAGKTSIAQSAKPGGSSGPAALLVARRGEEVEDLGAEHVDAAVGEVGERFGRLGLLLEALDAAVGAGDRDAELAGVVRPAWSPAWRPRRGTRGNRASPPGRCR